MYKIAIEDDFDLYKIAYSGQCFRARVFEDGTFRFICEDNVLYIKKLEDNVYNISCTAEVWKSVWFDYFDLDRDYKTIREKIVNSTKNSFISQAIDSGVGIRILRQDKWEMLLTFIISQRKSIPAIANAIERIASKFGVKITNEYESLYIFPKVVDMAAVSVEELRECGIGYRAEYIKSAIDSVLDKRIILEEIDVLSDEDLIEKLKGLRGVGEKVASCIVLFAYGRANVVPIDVWIKRAIEEEFEGVNVFAKHEGSAGILQQYIFYYQKNRHY